MDLGIRGKRAVVMGASKGLGYAVAHALASEGVDLVVSSSNLGRAGAAAERIAEETGVKAVALTGNVRTCLQAAKRLLNFYRENESREVRIGS